MANSAQRARAQKATTQQAKQTTLQRTLTSAINELGIDAALVAVFGREHGPLELQLCRAFTPREAEAILRSLSAQDLTPTHTLSAAGEASKAIRLRLITPSAKSLLGVPLTFQQRPYGVLVLGRKEGTSFSKKEKVLVESASQDITAALERASLFDGTLLWSRPWVAEEPTTSTAKDVERLGGQVSVATPDVQATIGTLLDETAQIMGYERAWVSYYDPIAGSLEVLGIAGELKGDPKKSLKPGQRLGLDESASGWAVRHRKPRVDHDLASTQGRFFDHKHLYKDCFQSALVVPFFVHGQVGGTLSLATKATTHYATADARSLEPVLLKLAELTQQPAFALPAQPPAEGGEGTPASRAVQGMTEPYIRKQERQAALNEFSAFLATEVREPLASIRAQMEDLTGEGILDFDPQVRAESAMRDLIRVEAILNEILDFAKPLELKRRMCRVPEMIENALTLVATDLEINRITVNKDYARNLTPVRCDDAKMQGVFLSIFKNALEAMTPGGRLEIQASMQRAGRTHQAQILIKNDGEPIPTEVVGKVFEPYFTTKRSGTGLGLATVKKVVEEHQGQISIASGPGQGTTVIIRLPGTSRGRPYPYRGRGRRPRRSRR